MTPLVFSADILVALFLATPWLFNTFWALVVSRGRTKPEETLPTRLYQWLNERIDYHGETIAWLAIDWVLLRWVMHAWTTHDTGIALCVTGISLAIFVFSGFGILAVHNLMLLPFASGSPLPLELDYHFPAWKQFEKDWRQIRTELLVSLPNLSGVPEVRMVLPDVGLTRRKNANSCNAQDMQGWQLLILRLGSRDVPTNIKRFPHLASLILDHPEIGDVLFSILQPGVSLKPHRGSLRAVLRYHLGLVVPFPDKAWIDVGGVRYHWREGESVLFDDCFTHSAYNESDELRIVLFLSVLRRVPPPLSWVSKLVALISRNSPYVRAAVARAETAAARFVTARDNANPKA